MSKTFTEIFFSECPLTMIFHQSFCYSMQSSKFVPENFYWCTSPYDCTVKYFPEAHHLEGLKNIYSTEYYGSFVDNYNFHLKFISQIEVEIVPL